MSNPIVRDSLFAASSAYHRSPVPVPVPVPVPAPASTPVPVSASASASAPVTAPVQIILVVLGKLQSINEFTEDHEGLFRVSSSDLSDRIDGLTHAVLQQPVGDLDNDCLTGLSPYDLCNIIKTLVNGLPNLTVLAEAKEPLFDFLYRVAANFEVTKMDPINIIKAFPKIKEFGDELHDRLLECITFQEKKAAFTQEYAQTLVVQMARLKMIQQEALQREAAQREEAQRGEVQCPSDCCTIA